MLAKWLPHSLISEFFNQMHLREMTLHLGNRKLYSGLLNILRAQVSTKYNIVFVNIALQIKISPLLY